MGEFNPPIGRRPVLQNCTIAELAVDPRYQRSIETKSSAVLIRRIARSWNWALCQPLVVARREGEQLYVVDGQHRLAAARLRGDIYDLPCVVQGYADPAEEAAHFVALNQERRPLGALDLFKAALASGDEGALAAMRLIEQAGLSLAPHSNFTAWKPGMVSHIGGILRCYRQHGEQLTARALGAIARAFDGEVLRYAGSIFHGVVQLLADLGKEADVELVDLILAGATQGEWMKDVAAIEADRSVHRSVAVVMAVRSAYDEAAAEVELEEQAA